jgi:uncharacterized protein with NRDE domain
MCLILFAWNSHHDYSLVVAANRDEFYERPTTPLGWWSDSSTVLGSRDNADVIGLKGTALGLSVEGRFAAITNIRAPSEKNPDLRTRGELTAKFLSQKTSIEEFIVSNQKSFMQYNGFNLLTADLSKPENHQLCWISNRILIGGKIRQRKTVNPVSIEPGIYGLSNAMLDTPWPKVRHGVAQFAQAIAMDQGSFNHPEHYLKFLKEANSYPDSELPSTGVSPDWERALSPIFIKTPHYGTRSSTLLRVRKDGNFQMLERRFDPSGEYETNSFEGQFIGSEQIDQGN